ncbi:endonuclease VII domain-containing protein [Candidatus Pacearchaeota archaeon]|nr:endonuclease VII domain-containing protein [Candidatus Pacearchaeota archaeon]
MKTTKRCSCCKTEKPLIDFYGNKSKPDGLSCDCKICSKRYHEIYRVKNREKLNEKDRKRYKGCKKHPLSPTDKLIKKDYYLKRTYGVTLKQYDKMFEDQNGVCAICGRAEIRTYKGVPTRLAVDHNHKTGKVRALLCSNCNQSLGIYENRKKEFEDYLRSFK